MTEGNVIEFPGVTFGELDSKSVLDGAKQASLDCVLVLGITPDGGLYSASATGDVPEILWLLETFKHHLLAGAGPSWAGRCRSMSAW